MKTFEGETEMKMVAQNSLLPPKKKQPSHALDDETRNRRKSKKNLESRFNDFNEEKSKTRTSCKFVNLAG